MSLNVFGILLIIQSTIALFKVWKIRIGPCTLRLHSPSNNWCSEITYYVGRIVSSTSHRFNFSYPSTRLVVNQTEKAQFDMLFEPYLSWNLKSAFWFYFQWRWLNSWANILHWTSPQKMPNSFLFFKTLMQISDITYFIYYINRHPLLSCNQHHGILYFRSYHNATPVQNWRDLLNLLVQLKAKIISFSLALL